MALDLNALVKKTFTKKHDFDTEDVLLVNQKSIQYTCKNCGIQHILHKDCVMTVDLEYGCRR